MRSECTVRACGPDVLAGAAVFMPNPAAGLKPGAPLEVLTVHHVLTLLGVTCMTAGAFAAQFPPPTVPGGLGVNIHFRGAPARDLDMLQAGGFKFIRMDFTWSSIEKQKGVYDFKPYDELTNALQARGIRALYILDYSNSLYEKEQSVRTNEGRRAFAKFAAVAAARYKGKGIIWELWNEPNIRFWEPQPSVEDYMKLAHAVFPAIREADPDSTCLAPATSGIPLDFLEACFKRGLLDLVDGVSVHPYRQSNPETVVPEIARLRALIARYSPQRPALPVVSGEWGYSVAWNHFEAAKQGRYLAREFLTNLSLGLPLSIFYDWHDDGPDPKEPEHHFGTVTLDYKPKPSYLAMQRLVNALRGKHFVKRLDSATDDWLLLFTDGTRSTVAAWTTGKPHDTAVLPGRKVRLTHDPQYLAVPADARRLAAEAAWTVVQPSVGVRGGASVTGALAPRFTVRVRNPFDRPTVVRFSVATPPGVTGALQPATRFTLPAGAARTLTWTGTIPRGPAREVVLTVTGAVGGFTSRQPVPFLLTNDVDLSWQPTLGGGFGVVVSNPSGDDFTGTLRITSDGHEETYVLKLAAGQVRVSPTAGAAQATAERRDGGVVVRLPITAAAARKGVRAVLREGETIVADTGVLRFVPVPVSTETAKAFNDGDAKVPATFVLTDASFAGPDAPGGRGVHLTYKYGKGWKFVRIAPPSMVPVEGKPKAMGVWVRGDKTNCSLRLRFTDADGRTFQPVFGRLQFSGWRYLTVPLDDPHVGHWDGAGDENRIAYPIRLNTFILVDGPRDPVSGAADFAGFRLVYKD